MSATGATPAYRGYRLQALYIANRIFEPQAISDQIFAPEEKEDLAIYRKGILSELVQVKSYSSLTLSDLEPEKESSFFHRALEYISCDPRPVIKVVNVGEIGPELTGAWSGEAKYQRTVKAKLLQKGFNANEIQNIFSHISLKPLSENFLEKKIFGQLNEISSGIDPHNAFDLLNKWLYDLSESQKSISRQSLIEKIDSIGQFLSDRTHHHQEWFTNIVPFEEKNISKSREIELKKEFFAGVSVRYEHILAELDFPRPKVVGQLKEAFRQRNAVIIHGASGQGKSALAYRYLHNHYSESCRYKVLAVENRKHALRTATALSGHAKTLQIPMVVYFDVSSRDQDWYELVAQLVQHPNIHVLVTIREEDFRRTNIPHHIEFSEIELSFNEAVAERIYYRAKTHIHKFPFLSFQDAWDKFGKSGPLLEFIYFLSQTYTLKRRLSEQVKRLQTETREKNLDPNEIHLLRLVSVITAYEGRLKIPALLNQLNIPEPNETLHIYEKEYLMRVDLDKQVIEALHPIRSQILSELLIDQVLYNWITLVKEALPFTAEEDWGSFLLRSFVKKPEKTEELIHLANTLNPSTWSGASGILESLLWVSVKNYLEKNSSVFMQAHELVGPAWTFVPDLDFGEDDTPDITGWWDNIPGLIPKESRERMGEIKKKQTPKTEVYKEAKAWLAEQVQDLKPPHTTHQWQSAAEVIYWGARFGFNQKLTLWAPFDILSTAFESLDLNNFSKLSLATFKINPKYHRGWIASYLPEIFSRLVQDYKIVALEENQEKLTFHYISYDARVESKKKETIAENNTIHAKTLERMQIIRQLFPEYKEYGAQGYGHQLEEFGFDFDDSRKTGVPKMHLPPQWPLVLNKAAIGMLHNKIRPKTWNDYLQLILALRKEIAEILFPANRKIHRYFQRDTPDNILASPPFSNNEWDDLISKVNTPPLLPFDAVDPWGFGAPEGSKQQYDVGQDLIPASVLQQVYSPYTKAEREYFNKLAAFLRQALHAIVLNTRAGKLLEGSHQKNSVVEYLKSEGVEPNYSFLSLVNLWDVYSNIKLFQNEFRSLFHERVNQKQLEELEKQEDELINQLMKSWLLYITKPRTSLASPKSQIPKKIKRTFVAFNQKIKNELGKIKIEGLKITNIDTSITWKEMPILAFQIDARTPIDIYSMIDRIISAVRKPFTHIEYISYEHIAFEIYIKYILLVPTVKGRLFERRVWPLEFPNAILGDHTIEEKPFLYSPHEITEDFFIETGLDEWVYENKQNILKLENAYLELMNKILLLSKLSKMPTPPEESIEILQTHINFVSEDISADIQSFIDLASTFLEVINEIPSERFKENNHFSESVEALNQIKEILLLEDGSRSLPLHELPGFSKSLQNLLPNVMFIKSIWIGEEINRLEKC